MKNVFRLKLMAILVIAFMSQSCFVEDDDGEVEERFAWQRTDAFGEGLYNSKIVNEELVVMGASSVYYNASITNQSSPTSLSNYLSRIGYFKLPIDGNFLVTRKENEVRIFPANNINLNNSFSNTGNQLDPDFVEFEDISFLNGTAFGISNNGTVMIPYRRMDDRNISENNPSFILLKTRNVGGKIEVHSKQTVQPTTYSNFANTVQLETFNNFFIVRVSAATIAIYEDGSFEQINRLPTTVLDIEGKITAIGIDKPAGELVFHEYNGQWSVTNKYKVNNNIILDGKFTMIDNQLISFIGGRIFHLTMNGNNINVEELDNSRLERGGITSISQIDANTVFATLACVGGGPETCGGFFKSMENFYKPKLQ